MMFRAFGIGFALLFFILPIPGTIALRYSLLLVLLTLIVFSWRRCQFGRLFKERQISSLLIWLAALTCWLLVQAVWISDESAWALGEIRGQWLPALLTAAIGLGVVLISRHLDISRSKLLGGLVLLLFAQTIFSLIVSLPGFLANGAFSQSKTLLTAGKLEISYWNNILLAFLAVDGLSRWIYRQALTTLSLPFLFIGIAVVFLSNLAFGARNGMIGAGLLLSSLALLVLWHERQKIGVGKALGFVGGAVLLIGLLAWANYQMDERWQRFEETARIAWQGTQHDAWLDPDSASLPVLKSGQPVEASAYLRISWIRAGLDLIAEYPWGVGYGRNAFGHALRKTTETGLGHAHSGIVDWTLGVGLPGLLLWLGFFSWLLWQGMRRYFVRRDPAGLILTFVVGGFLGRMLLDSINRDHMLMLFFLILVILVALPEEPVNQ